MLRKTILFLLVLTSINTFGQRVYWASEVEEFSSELSAYEYSAEQVLGKPNALPQGGDNPNAWMPAKPNKLEFITVSFERAIRVQQIVIAESYNPSAVYEIYLYDQKGTEYLVHTFEPRPVDLKSRLLRTNIEKTAYDVEALRIIIDGRKVPGYSAIDAIGVSSSSRPIEISIDQPQNLRENILVERLSDNVNSPYQETRPLIAPDGQTLYYSRANHPENLGGEEDENDIWYSELNPETGEWEKSKNMGEPLNTKGPNFISSITPDGNAMTVLLGNEYTNRDKMKPGVSVSTKTSDGWSKPQSLEIINAFIESTDGNYFLANNRRVLIMAIDRYDTQGGKDLYVSFLQRDKKWTEPMNLGNDVNTAHMESSPYLAADNETLYFSSKGFSGYGGSDVYISRRLDNTWTNWTEPENLGPDINSIGDDVFFNIPPSGQFAYYSKSQEEGNGDIYKIAMPVFYQPAPVVSVAGKVIDAQTKQPLASKISYDLLPENSSVGFTVSDSVTGEYEILLPAGSAYEYKAEADGYKSATATIDLLDETDFVVINRIIELTTGEDEPFLASVDSVDREKVQGFISGETRELILSSAVLFEFASDYVNESSYPVLDQIAEFMKKNPALSLILEGHTDSVGPAQYNLSLSKRRAQSVEAYLVEKGIKKSRFETKGYGMQQPVATNDTKEGRSQNRRVVFSIKE
jgi:outer membrane protein OmpA-like peptidoglycan-associated protein